MQRCNDLRKQLETIYQRTFGHSAAGDSRVLLPVPTASEETALRQVMLTGQLDCIARRVSLTAMNERGNSGKLTRRKRLTAYLSCDPGVAALLYLHPHSCLHRKDPTAALVTTTILYTLDDDVNLTHTCDVLNF